MTSKRKHLVITGANGTVGQQLIAVALANDWDTTALVRNPSRMSSVLNGRVSVLPWQLAADVTLPPRCEGADAVCHLAAHIPLNHRDVTEADACFRLNTVASLALLQSARERGIGTFVYASAGNAYVQMGRSAREDDPLYPAHRASVYLTSKLAGEILCQSSSFGAETRFAALRISSVYGPGMRAGTLVATYIANAEKQMPLRVDNGGRYSMDLVYAGDVAEAVMRVLHSGVDGIFNIGSGRSTTNLELARQVVRLCGASQELIHVMPENATMTELGYAPLDITKAKRELGFEPLALLEGLERYRAHLTSTRQVGAQ